MIEKKPSCSYQFRFLKELVRKKKIKANVVRTTNSRKIPCITEYELRKDTEEKKIINEINRQNLYSDYGV